MMLPTEISPIPLKAAKMVTPNSGANVPKATTVNPITNSDIPNRLAMAAAESV